MKHTYLIILLVLMSSRCIAQVSTEDVRVLETIIRDIQPTGQIVYSDYNLSYYFSYHTLRSLLKRKVRYVDNNSKLNTITLTKKERIYLAKQSELNMITRWRDSLFAASKYVEQDSLNKFIEKIVWPWYNKYNVSQFIYNQQAMEVLSKRLPIIYSFTKPVYIRDSTICLVCIDCNCPEYPNDFVCFYKKDNGVWVKCITMNVNVRRFVF